MKLVFMLFMLFELLLAMGSISYNPQNSTHVPTQVQLRRPSFQLQHTGFFTSTLEAKPKLDTNTNKHNKSAPTKVPQVQPSTTGSEQSNAGLDMTKSAKLRQSRDPSTSSYLAKRKLSAGDITVIALGSFVRVVILLAFVYTCITGER